MSITRDFKETINDRVQKDPEFAKALLNEAISVFLNGEPETAKLILRDLMNITTELKKLADENWNKRNRLEILIIGRGNS